MGLFSGKKKTYVSSVAYNLSGDPEDGDNQLKYTVLQALMKNESVPLSLTGSMLQGQGIKLRSAYRYARDFYEAGLPYSGATIAFQPDLTVLEAILDAKHRGYQTSQLVTIVGTADFVWWAEQYLAAEYAYDRVEQAFMAPPKGVHPEATVSYDLEPSGLIRILLTNPTNLVTVLEFRPKDLVSMGNYVHSVYTTQNVFKQKDETITRPTQVGDQDGVQTTSVVVDRLRETQTTVTKVETTVATGTTTIRTTVETTVVSRPHYFIYRLGSGTYPTLDAWNAPATLTSPYWPAIPLRQNNVDVTSTSYREKPQYKTSAKFLDKLGIDLEDVAKSVNSNQSISDIDHAYIVIGVQLNTNTKAGQKYLYNFFEYLRNISTVNKNEFAVWKTAWLGSFNIAAPKTNILEIYTPENRANNYDIKLQWQYIDTTVKSGVIAAGANIGDVDITMSPVFDSLDIGQDYRVDQTKMYARKQLTEDTYEELEICGLYYDNYIYNGKSVSISAWDAFHDSTEEGFIIPLNQTIVGEMNLLQLNALSQEAFWIVFNCYKVVKQKWYQTSIFKIIIVIIAIIIIVVTWGAGTPAAAGMIASAFAAIGIVGTLGIVLAATLYVLAMMVIMTLLTKVSTKLFGEKWGQIIAVVVMFVSMNWGNLTAVAAGTATASVTAQTILAATTAVTQLYGAYVNGKIQGIQQDMTKLGESYKAEMEKIEKLTEENLGTNLDAIDVFGYIEASNQFLFEQPDTFFARTLLSGSEICDITYGMIDNFAEVGLQLPNTG